MAASKPAFGRFPAFLAAANDLSLTPDGFYLI